MKTNPKINEEVLLDAIGDISDKRIAAAESYRPPQVMPGRFRRFLTVQRAGLAAATLALVLGTVLMLHFLAPVAPVEPPVATEGGGTATSPHEPPVPRGPEYVWIVPPTLEHGISYCAENDAYIYRSVSADLRICETTGAVTEEAISVTAADDIFRAYLFDPNHDMFGTFERNSGGDISVDWVEASQLISNGPGTIKLVGVHVVDLDSFSPELAFSCSSSSTPTMAVFLNRTIVTEPEFASAGNGREVPRMITVTRAADSKSSILGITNALEPLVPFEFDEIMLISDTTAFARVGDKWGIIGFNGYVPPTAPTAGYVWIAAPFYECPKWYCPDCGEQRHSSGMFFDFGQDLFVYNYSEVMDEITLRPTGIDASPFSGVSEPVWVYDRDLDLIGHTEFGRTNLVLHPTSEFSERFPFAVNKAIVVHLVDSTQREFDPDIDETVLSESAYSGGAAVAFNGTFVTEFEFDTMFGHCRCLNGRLRINGRLAAVATAVRENKSGIIGSNGETVVPFEFDDLWIISDTTAFARVGDKWGIIGFNGYVGENTAAEPFTAPLEMIGYFFDSEGRRAIVDNDENLVNLTWEFNPEAFRQYFLGTWNAPLGVWIVGGNPALVIDETEKLWCTVMLNSWRVGFNAERDVIAVRVSNPAESAVMWINIKPDFPCFAKPRQNRAANNAVPSAPLFVLGT
jgi:hypothetical protein